MPSKFQRSDAVGYAYEALEAVKHNITDDEWADLDALFTRIVRRLRVEDIGDLESFIKAYGRAARK